MKSQELKNKILKNLLPKLSVDPLGLYVDSEKLGKRVYKSYDDYYFNSVENVIIDPENILSEQDYQEIARAMINGIKDNPRCWKIDQEGELKIIKHNSGKKHYEKGFDNEEWKEIENALNSQQGENKEDDNIPEDTPSNPSSSEQQAQQEQPPKEIKHRGYYYHRGNKY